MFIPSFGLPFVEFVSLNNGSILFAFEVIATELLRSFFGVGGFEIDGVEFSPKNGQKKFIRSFDILKFIFGGLEEGFCRA